MFGCFEYWGRRIGAQTACKTARGPYDTTCFSLATEGSWKGNTYSICCRHQPIANILLSSKFLVNRLSFISTRKNWQEKGVWHRTYCISQCKCVGGHACEGCIQIKKMSPGPCKNEFPHHHLHIPLALGLVRVSSSQLTLRRMMPLLFWRSVCGSRHTLQLRDL